MYLALNFGEVFPVSSTKGSPCIEFLPFSPFVLAAQRPGKRQKSNGHFTVVVMWLFYRGFDKDYLIETYKTTVIHLSNRKDQLCV